jgi:hypothetical protein
MPSGVNSRQEDIVAEKAEAQKVEKYNGYCVKCKEKRDFEGVVAISKTGMRMAKGPCPVCGTTVNRILGKA